MKKFDSKWVKYIGGAIGGIVAGIALMFGGTQIVYPAISQLVGLSVAQSATLWNNVKDAAAGDALSSGILAQQIYAFNGLTFDRMRGDTTNGLDVDVTRLSGNVSVIGTATDNTTNSTTKLPVIPCRANAVAPTFTENFMVPCSTDLSGALRTTGGVVGAVTPVDAYANPTTAIQTWSLTGLFNGTTWDRVRSATADALASTGIAAGNNVLFNGSTFDRQDSASATNNTATTTLGVAYSTPLSTWTVINTTSASATAVGVSKSAGGGTIRHVATGLTICNYDTAPDTIRLVHLRNGASGAGVVLKTWMLSVTVANASRCENVTGLNITGSANTDMTLEFASAPAGATQSQTVSLQGYSTP